MRRVLCLARGGHAWRTTTDGAGAITSCARCGALRHLRSASADDASFLMHTDVAAEFGRRPTRGTEDLDADGARDRRAPSGD
jgi:hypothetical protein